MLLAASYYFYGAWDWRFLGLLHRIDRRRLSRGALHRPRPPIRADAALALILSLVFNLGDARLLQVLQFLRREPRRRLRARIGWHLDPVTLQRDPADRHLVLHVHDDQLRHRRVPPGDPADDQLHRLRAVRRVFPASGGRADSARVAAAAADRAAAHDHAEQIVEGLWLIGWGYFQKMFVADNLARAGRHRSSTPVAYADAASRCWSRSTPSPSRSTATSPATRTSRAASRSCMGIELNVNFLFPYFVTSPQEFWRHWHISLSTWLRDYLYIPLGGNRGSESRPAQPDDHDGARRALARRGLDVRALGCLSGPTKRCDGDTEVLGKMRREFEESYARSQRQSSRVWLTTTGGFGSNFVGSGRCPSSHRRLWKIVGAPHSHNYTLEQRVNSV